MCGNSGQSPKEAGLRTLLESIRLKRGRSEEKARKRATHTGHQQEEPYLRHRLSADHECRTKASRRIYAHARDVNSEDMNCHQCDPDR